LKEVFEGIKNWFIACHTGKGTTTLCLKGKTSWKLTPVKNEVFHLPTATTPPPPQQPQQLEPQTTSSNWFCQVMIWNHPIETTI